MRAQPLRLLPAMAAATVANGAMYGSRRAVGAALLPHATARNPATAFACRQVVNARTHAAEAHAGPQPMLPPPLLAPRAPAAAAVWLPQQHPRQLLMQLAAAAAAEQLQAPQQQSPALPPVRPPWALPACSIKVCRLCLLPRP
jgi:hypothetical protein